MQYSRNIAEILQKYHDNIMVTYHSYITVILCNIYVIFI